MLELEHRFRVVDAHAQLVPDEESVSARGRAISPENLEREMLQAGVVQSVVFPAPDPEGGAYLRANNAVARLSVERPFAAFARIDGPNRPETGVMARLRNTVARRSDRHTSPEDIEQYAYDARFHGFKLDPPRDGIPDADVLAQLEDVTLPVLVHGGERFPPEEIERTLLGRSFPVIIAHFGGHPLRRELMDETIDLLEDHDNCYLETSLVRYRAQLERAFLEHPGRILFGSGAPATHPNVAIMEILTLDVSEDAMRKVFTKNATRVIDGLSA